MTPSWEDQAEESLGLSDLLAAILAHALPH